MKKLLITLGLLLATVSGAFAMTFNDVKNLGKPVVVMFHMHGCSACRKFAPMFDKTAAKFSSKFNFVKEDIDKSDVAKTLNFTTVPAIYIIEPKTMDAKRIGDDCAWDKACFESTLNKY